MANKRRIAARNVWEDMVTHDGVYAVDAEQHIIYWAPSAQRLFGHRPEDAVGKLCYELVAGRDDRNFRFCRRDCPVMANARRGRTTPDYDILCETSAGESKWLNITVAIPARKESEFGVLHLARDVTRRRHIEEFARKASSALRSVMEDPVESLAQRPEANPLPMPKLSTRETEVLRLLASGMKTEQMAQTLVLEPITVRNHITRLMTKLGVQSRLQAVVYASQHGII